MTKFLCVILSIVAFMPIARAENPACVASDKPCLMKQLEATAATIENEKWKDKTYRELAKSYTYEGMEEDAIRLITKVQNADTKAMTIRGIGFAAADSKWSDKARYDALFEKLHTEAAKIDHAPSHGIALTYIAMAQAFAGDDAGATETAKGMTNDALRHKAFGESAEIQAERGDFDAAMASIAHIDSLPFRNKAHRIISKIFVQKDMIDEAYDAAMKIDNAYMQAEAVQFILNADNPEENAGQ
ncbi:MAG: hypothetical protein AAF569_06885 [Pseudomonadota bacterium]